MNRKILCSLFEFTPKTLYNWKKEERPIIELIERYLSEDDIKEFIETKRIERLENIEHYAHYEKKLIEQIKGILWSLKGDDASDTLYLISMIQKEYQTKKKKFFEFKDKYYDLEEYHSYLLEYDFIDILKEKHDQYGDAVDWELQTIKIEEYILKFIFYTEIFHRSFTKKVSPRSQYSIQSTILELYDNNLLFLVIKNIKELTEEVEQHREKVEKELLEKIKMIDDEQEYSEEWEYEKSTYITKNYPDGVPPNLDDESLVEEIDAYINKKDEYKKRWKLLESNFPHLSKDEIRKIINDEMTSK